MNGYNGNLAISAGNKGWRSSGFLSGQQGKLTYSANIMYNAAKSKGTVTEMSRTASDGSRMDIVKRAILTSHSPWVTLVWAMSLTL